MSDAFLLGALGAEVDNLNRDNRNLWAKINELREKRRVEGEWLVGWEKRCLKAEKELADTQAELTAAKAEIARIKAERDEYKVYTRVAVCCYVHGSCLENELLVAYQTLDEVCGKERNPLRQEVRSDEAVEHLYAPRRGTPVTNGMSSYYDMLPTCIENNRHTEPFKIAYGENADVDLSKFLTTDPWHRISPLPAASESSEPSD